MSKERKTRSKKAGGARRKARKGNRGWPPHDHSPSNWTTGWVTCPACGKKAFFDRKKAATFARAMGGEMNAYACVHPGGVGFHAGHLPEPVKRGDASRAQMCTPRELTVDT